MKLKFLEQKSSERTIMTYSRKDISSYEFPALLDRLQQVQKTDAIQLSCKQIRQRPKTVCSKQLDNQLNQILSEIKGQGILQLLVNIFEVQFYESTPILIHKSIEKALSFMKTINSEALRVVYLIFSVKRPVPIEAITQQLLITLVKLTRSPAINLTSFSFDIETVSCDSKLVFIIFSRIYMLFRNESMFHCVVEFLNKEFSIEAINEYLVFFLFVIRKSSNTLPNQKLFFSILANRAMHYNNQRYMYCIINIWKELLGQTQQYTPATTYFINNSIKSMRGILADQNYSSHFPSLYDLLIQMLKSYKQKVGGIMMKEVYPLLMKRNKISKSVSVELIISLIQNYIQEESYLKYRIQEQINLLNYEMAFNMTNPRNVAKILKYVQEMCKEQDQWIFEDTNLKHNLRILQKSQDYLVKQSAIQTINKFFRKDKASALQNNSC